MASHFKMSSVISEHARITPPPYFKRQAADQRLLGYWLDGNSWERMECAGDGEAYFTSGSYAGCNELHTACTLARTQDAGGKLLTCNQDASCISITIHENTPAPTPDPSARTHLLCAAAWSSNAFDLFRTTTASSSPSSPSAFSPSSTSSSLDISSTPSQTSDSISSVSSGSPLQQHHSKSSVNAGVVAGATIAGIALLLIVSFCVWYFGFYHKKNKHEAQLVRESSYKYGHYGNSQYYPSAEMWEGHTQGLHPIELQESSHNYDVELPVDHYGPNR